MGSVDRDYRCPWCGRRGNGGYSPDAVGYPICAGGEFSGLWRQFVDLELDVVGFRSLQLQAILSSSWRPFWLSDEVLDLVVAHLLP